MSKELFIAKLVNNNKDDYNYYYIHMCNYLQTLQDNIITYNNINLSNLNLNIEFDKLSDKFKQKSEYLSYNNTNPFPIKHYVCEDYENKIYINNFSYIYSIFNNITYGSSTYTLFYRHLLRILNNIDKDLCIYKLSYECKMVLDFTCSDNICLDNMLILKSKIIDLNIIYNLINKDMERIYIYKNDIELCIKELGNYKHIEYDNNKYCDYDTLFNLNIKIENEKQKLGIYDKQLAEIKNENSILKQQIKELQDNYLNLKSNFEIYTELINELRNENKELKKQVKQLQNENVDLYSNLI